MTQGRINVIGMPFAEHGLAQSMRDKTIGLIEAGAEVDVVEINYSSLAPVNKDLTLQDYVTDTPRGDINLICLNPTMYTLALRDHPTVFEDRYNILLPYWEFKNVPDNYVEALRRADEIWTPGHFLTSVFKTVSINPVIEMPLHVRMDTPPKARDFRSELGIAADDFAFLMCFDCNSMVPRKDPEAAILAFLKAFGNKPEIKARLVLKYVYQDTPSLRIEDVKAFETLAALDDRIILLHEALDRPDMLDLLDASDAYVSPHRCEGLGRLIVESMHLGKPVTATNYSGVSNAIALHIYPLRFQMHDVGTDAFGNIRPDFQWAVCDVEHLSLMMARMEGDREASRAFGVRGQEFMRTLSDAKTFGEAALARIKDIRKNTAGIGRFEMHSGERQVGTDLASTRRDHVARYDWAIEMITQHLGTDGELNGLDLFCGGGYGTQMLSAFGPVTGIDGSSDAIAFAQEHFSSPNTTYQKRRAPFDKPLEPNLDYAVAMEAIEHAEDADAFIDTLTTPVRDGGLVILSTPNSVVMPLDLARHKFHTQHFSKDKIIELFAKRGFANVGFGGQVIYSDRTKPGGLMPESEMDVLPYQEGQFNVFCFVKDAERAASQAPSGLTVKPPLGAASAWERHPKLTKSANKSTKRRIELYIWRFIKRIIGRQ